MPDRAYAIALPACWIIRDAEDDRRLERLEFHLKHGDYFPMVATVLGFVEEALAECKSDIVKAATLKTLKKDLMHLHKHYRITPKQ